MQSHAKVSNDSDQFLSLPGPLDLTNWNLQETCFGDLHCDPSCGTLLSAGLLKENGNNVKQLAKHKTIIVCLFSSFGFSEENLFDAPLKLCTFIYYFSGCDTHREMLILKKKCIWRISCVQQALHIQPWQIWKSVPLYVSLEHFLLQF